MVKIELKQMGTATYRKEEISQLIIKDLYSKGFKALKFENINHIGDVLISIESISGVTEALNKTTEQSLKKSNKGLTKRVLDIVNKEHKIRFGVLIKILQEEGFISKGGMSFETYIWHLICHIKTLNIEEREERVKSILTLKILQEIPESNPQSSIIEAKSPRPIPESLIQKEVLEILKDGKPRYSGNIFRQITQKVNLNKVPIAYVDEALNALKLKGYIINPRPDIYILNQK
jgi:hypothetical protein